LVEGLYSNNEKDSVWTSYHRNGNPAYAVEYNKGVKNGDWTYYWEDKTVRYRCHYRNGKRDGEERCYFENGTPSYQADWLDGQFVGTSKTFHKEGALLSEYVYENGLLNGISNTYYDNGNLRESILYKDGEKHTIIETKDHNGLAVDGGTLKNGIGTVLRLGSNSLTDEYPGVQILQLETLKEGIRDGAYFKYSFSGKEMISGQYVDGKYSGEWFFTNKAGAKRKVVGEENIREKMNSPDRESGPANVFKIVEAMPVFPGGEENLFEFLGRHIRYPKKAKFLGVSGRIFCTFVVEPTGELSGIRILRGIGSGCDEEVVRIMNIMPWWTPGFQNNKPVRVQFNLPIFFNLK
jgi:TonB family protein